MNDQNQISQNVSEQLKLQWKKILEKYPLIAISLFLNFKKKSDKLDFLVQGMPPIFASVSDYLPSFEVVEGTIIDGLECFKNYMRDLHDPVRSEYADYNYEKCRDRHRFNVNR